MGPVDAALEAAEKGLLGERLEEARTFARSARDLAAAAGDDRRLSAAENLVGEIELERGDWEEAGRRFGVAREHAAAVRDESLLLDIESNDAATWARLGQPSLVHDSLHAALGRIEYLEGHPKAVRILRNLGLALAVTDQSAAADEMLVQALTLAKRATDHRSGAALVMDRARLALGRRDVLRAHTLMSIASALVERAGSDALAAEAVCLEGEAYRVQGHVEPAERSLRQAIELAREAEVLAVEARAWAELAELLVSSGRTREAVDAWQAARLAYIGLGARTRAAIMAERAAAARARPAVAG